MVAGLSLAVSRRPARPRIAAGDFVLIALATHKLSRRISKDSVTSPFRAPFTELCGPEGPGEVKEVVTGTGLRRAIGELITCPFCLGQWVATGFTFGLVLAPRPTRIAATLFATAAVADFLQFGYAAAERVAEG